MTFSEFCINTAEFTIVLFLAGHLNTLSIAAFKRTQQWWRDRQFNKELKWLEEHEKSLPHDVRLVECWDCRPEKILRQVEFVKLENGRSRVFHDPGCRLCGKKFSLDHTC
jgi:hypothetical protein